MPPGEIEAMAGYAVMVEIEEEPAQEGDEAWIYWMHAGVLRVPARTQRSTARTMLLDGQGAAGDSKIPQLPLAAGQSARVALVPEAEIDGAFAVAARTRLVVEVVA